MDEHASDKPVPEVVRGVPEPISGGETGGAAGLSVRVLDALGEELARTLSGVLGELRQEPGGGAAGEMGPVAAARLLGLDKVLLSRVMKATRMRDGAGALRAMPGPEPLRRLVSRSAEQGVSAGALAAARAAVDRYECFLRDNVKGRGMLDTILSAWDPGARREFESRRKQTAFSAISQIRGAQARVNHATVIVGPSDQAGMLDVVWVTGYLGLYRSRPGARVKFASRRMTPGVRGRKPESIDGRALDTPEAMLLPAFCSSPMPELDATTIGEAVFYMLGGTGFGVRSAVDVVYAEVNRGELPRFVPEGSGRRRFFFAETAVPSMCLQFDVLVHRDLGWAEPELLLYDTAYEGAANPNDRTRDFDRLDLAERIERLGRSASQGAVNLRSGDVPRYTELMSQVCEATRLPIGAYEGYRLRMEYPLYGVQVTAAFPGVEGPTPTGV